MTVLFAIWIILIATNQQVMGDTLITVDNGGKASVRCCEGKCLCSSLHMALQSAYGSVIVNITSEVVNLDGYTVIGPPTFVSNITITSDINAIIKCHNNGSLSISNTINVTIRGITWDQCGDPNYPYVSGGVDFGSTCNLTIDSCTFQYSQICALNVEMACGNIIIKNSNFISNGLSKDGSCGGLSIGGTQMNTTIMISDSVFIGNGYFSTLSEPIYGLSIMSDEPFRSGISLTINNSIFTSNSGGIYLKVDVATFPIFILSEVVASDNINEGIKLSQLEIAKGNITLMISNSIFNNNSNGGIVGNSIFTNDVNSEVTFTVINTNFTDNRATDASNAALAIAIYSPGNSPISIYVQHSNFVGNSNGDVYISTSSDEGIHLVQFYDIIVKESVSTGSSSGSGTVSVSLQSSLENFYEFHSVKFISNEYSGFIGGNVFVQTANIDNCISVINCVFQNNTGAAFHLVDGVTDPVVMIYATHISFVDVQFTNNRVDDIYSVVYVVGGGINSTQIIMQSTHFINNTGTALQLIMSTVTFFVSALFKNNTANSGAALYLQQGTQVYFDDNVTVQFVNNTGTQYGGAIYTDLPSTCPRNGVMFHSNNTKNFTISFVNNKAGIIGNSLYFNIQEFCEVYTNVSSNNSLLYLPYKFNYSEALSSAVVTSPHSIMLYFPNHDGSCIDNKTFFVNNKILGEAITFTGAVFDYFNNSAEPTQFHVQCINGCADHTLADDQLLIDNISLLSITIYGHRVGVNPINITLGLTSILPSFNEQISVQLVIELQQCFSGYYYNVRFNQCVCYNHKDIVHCYDGYNEIKRGYWFGTITNAFKPTVSLCPSRYCDFGSNRKETRQGYCIIPPRLDDQCSSHRTGVACGECKSGYTLAYDSPDCISADKCSIGMTILVIVLTILYWIAIVASVFGLMYFQFQISSGYAYGIIYYYSIVDILLVNNPYISDVVFQVVATLASFAKLTPQLFGQLCLVEGLSRIDQQFIHYSHAIAVSLIILIIVLVARYSATFTRFVAPFIIRVICLLLLLSYTSLASTSLQLLSPLIFSDVDEVRTYSSPDIKYFTGRHLVYAIVAILCEVIVVIGLPLFLLLEPFLRRRINLVRIKPLVDQFQGCYKDKYRWFAAYYLICRQVIILIVYIGNGDYYNMLYYLQTACIIIVMIHGWVQPYKNALLNGLDEVILLVLVLIINLNTFSFLSSVSSEISVVLLLIPLLLICLVAIRKFLHHRFNREYRELHNVCEDEDNNYNQNREGANVRCALVVVTKLCYITIAS